MSRNGASTKDSGTSPPHVPPLSGDVGTASGSAAKYTASVWIGAEGARVAHGADHAVVDRGNRHEHDASRRPVRSRALLRDVALLGDERHVHHGHVRGEQEAGLEQEAHAAAGSAAARHEVAVDLFGDDHGHEGVLVALRARRASPGAPPTGRCPVGQRAASGPCSWRHAASTMSAARAAPASGGPT